MPKALCLVGMVVGRSVAAGIRISTWRWVPVPSGQPDDGHRHSALLRRLGLYELDDVEGTEVTRVVHPVRLT